MALMLKLAFDSLDWDNGNLQKVSARVPLKTLEDFFKQELLIKKDNRIYAETRFIAVGYIAEFKRYIAVIFTFRYKENLYLVRPISARYMHKKEQDFYELEIKKIKEKK